MWLDEVPRGVDGNRRLAYREQMEPVLPAWSAAVSGYEV
jgi:hypothetical protein